MAARPPTRGSYLGAISELVKRQTNGLLTEFKSLAEWGRTSQHLADHLDILVRLRSGIRPPRTMAEVADEMTELGRISPLIRRRQLIKPPAA